MGDVDIVFFDLETTGFAKDDEIIQIAACSLYSSFNVYITPTKPVHPRATEVTGLEFYGNRLYLHNQRVDSTYAYHALNQFIDYLKEFNNNVILVAHNCFGFDMPRLLNLAKDLGFVNDLEDIVDGFSDSLVILKSELKDVRSGKGSFTLQSLVEDYLPNESTDDMHNAERDAELLMLLLFNSELDITAEQLVQSSKTIDQYFEGIESKMAVEKAKESLEYYSNVLPMWVINKMARTKIDGELLRETYQERGFEGVKRLFSQNYYGRPRVTYNISIIRNICSSLDEDLEDNSDQSYASDSSSDYY